MPPFAVSLSVVDDALVVSVRGEVDVLTAPDLAKCLTTAVDGTPDTLVVDLGQTTFFGAAGINALAQARHELSSDSELIVRCPNPSVAHLLRLLKTDTILRIEE